MREGEGGPAVMGRTRARTSTTVAPSGVTITGLQSSSAISRMRLDERARRGRARPRARRRPPWARRGSRRGAGRSAASGPSRAASPSASGVIRTATSRTQLDRGAAGAAGDHRAEAVVDDADEHLDAAGAMRWTRKVGAVAGGGDRVAHLARRRAAPRSARAAPSRTAPASVLWTSPGATALGRPGRRARGAARRRLDAGGRARLRPAGCRSSAQSAATLLRRQPLATAAERVGEDRGGLVPADSVRCGGRDPRRRAPAAVPGGVAERAARILREGYTGTPAARSSAGGASAVMKTASDRDVARPRPRRPRSRAATSSARRHERRDEDHDDGVHAPDRRRTSSSARPYASAVRRGDHVDRVARRAASAAGTPAAAARRGAERRHVETVGLARVGAQDPQPAGVRDDRDARPRGSGWLASSAATSNSSSSVSVRITPAWRNSASTVDVGGREQRAGVRARRRARPAAERPLLTATIGFARRPAARSARTARVAERLEVQQDDVGARVVAPSTAAGRCRRCRPCCRPRRTTTGRGRASRRCSMHGEAERAALRQERRRCPAGG